MGRLIVVVGDRTSGGGRVITGAPFTDIHGSAVARISDKATCPKHQGIFSIVTGDSTWRVDGQPVARDGDRLECGCSLMAGTQLTVDISSGGAPASEQSVAPVAERSPWGAASTMPSKPICEACLRAAADRGTAFLRR
ncbi:PAAR domain-containing protein [Stenotrophomonas maltophilia]|uniref:PAAR domain-containing protein n=1 Tax=Stenotrophomonas maltophilia group TaxID=995085 RepID=UPI0015E005C5|nr:PAAR domain-containing protein [Stenotrophomonas maltophilia]MBA0433190.1 PAAR domain-containing protein [Stenotrophomonas maltophilia]MDZ5815295.1 PAAR domain-containing protein [Stenotrophomonas maltophilia]HDS1675481.1 PAAR domain-containing protein [Stenotrophomonas maltophilia]